MFLIGFLQKPWPKIICGYIEISFQWEKKDKILPGIFGAYKAGGVKALMESMILSMNKDNSFHLDRFLDEKYGFFVGRVDLGIFRSVDQPVFDLRENCWIIFHGELYDSGEVSNNPFGILKEYISQGDQCAESLNGNFHFIIYDGRIRALKLFTDKFGTHPLYYAIWPGGFLFSPNISAMLNEPSLPLDVDYRSLADFYHYGQILCQKTLFANIKLLPAGSVLTYLMADHNFEVTSYWKLEQLFVERGDSASMATIKEVVPSLVEAIKIRSRDKEQLGLSLSGGLDTRGILAGLGREAKGIFTYTLGLAGCADQNLAERMARMAETKHQFVELDQKYLNDYEMLANSMILLSDGMYHPHESTEMLALEYFKKSPFRILLRGHGGEVAKAALAYPIMVGREVSSFSTPQEILEYIFRITNLVLRDIEIDGIFQPWFSEIMKKTPRRSLEESCGMAAEKLMPADVCIYYYINEHIRRQVVPSLEVFRTQIEIRLPYVDEFFLKALLKLPLSHRSRGEVHVELIRECMPGLLEIPNSNTGAPLDAGPLRLFATDKFNSLMRQLRIRGYRHYTEFQSWYRDQFKEATRKILFSDQTASRKLYNMDKMKILFEDHISGKKNYSHLLGTMTGIELWFRNFVDGTKNYSD
jgi:asparagine synthase (glutamine-hydrolysing)